MIKYFEQFISTLVVLEMIVWSILLMSWSIHNLGLVLGWSLFCVPVSIISVATWNNKYI